MVLSREDDVIYVDSHNKKYFGIDALKATYRDRNLIYGVESWERITSVLYEYVKKYHKLPIWWVKALENMLISPHIFLHDKEDLMEIFDIFSWVLLRCCPKRGIVSMFRIYESLIHKNGGKYDFVRYGIMAILSNEYLHVHIGFKNLMSWAVEMYFKERDGRTRAKLFDLILNLAVSGGHHSLKIFKNKIFPEIEEWENKHFSNCAPTQKRIRETKEWIDKGLYHLPIIYRTRKFMHMLKNSDKKFIKREEIRLYHQFRNGNLTREEYKTLSKEF